MTCTGGTGSRRPCYYLWRGKYGGMSASDAKRLKTLKAKSARLKKLLVEAMLEREASREVLRNSGDRTGASQGGAEGDSQMAVRTPCPYIYLMCMSTSSLHYQPAPDRNTLLLDADSGTCPPSPALRSRHDLCQWGLMVNHKRVERLYAEAQIAGASG